MNHLIELARKQMSDNEKRARYSAAGGALTGAASGAMVGGYASALQPKNMKTYVDNLKDMIKGEGGSLTAGDSGESWKQKDKPFGKGGFSQEERVARAKEQKKATEARQAKKRFKKSIGKGALVGSSLMGVAAYLGAKGQRPKEK
jgi:hypothetical protein